VPGFRARRTVKLVQFASGFHQIALTHDIVAFGHRACLVPG
jgi:hypothetical protein